MSTVELVPQSGLGYFPAAEPRIPFPRHRDNLPTPREEGYRSPLTVLPEPGQAEARTIDDGPTLTISDFLGWEETRSQFAAVSPDKRQLDRPIGWPFLWQEVGPPPPSGALLLLPATTLARLRPQLPTFYAEMLRVEVAALVIPPGVTLDPAPAELVVLHARGDLDLPAERALFHLLHARRQHLASRRLALEQALTDRALDGRTPTDLLAVGAAELGRTVYHLDQFGTIIGCHGSSVPVPAANLPALPLRTGQRLLRLRDQHDGRSWLLARVAARAAATQGGWLAIADDRTPLDEVDRDLLVRIAAVVATVGQRQAQEGHGQRVAALINPETEPGQRLALARSLDLDPAGTFAILRLVFVGGGVVDWALVRVLQQALSGAGVRAESFANADDHPLGLLLHTSGNTVKGLRAIPALLGAVAVQHPRLRVAIGGARGGLSSLIAGSQQAAYGLALLQAGLLPGPIAAWDDGSSLGVYRPLYALWSAELGSTYLRDTFGALLDRDTQQVNDLLRSLLTYLRHGCNIGGAATELAIHRNTLTYRLRQIEQLTGHSPYNPAQLPALFLAALLWSLPTPVPEPRGVQALTTAP